MPSELQASNMSSDYVVIALIPREERKRNRSKNTITETQGEEALRKGETGRNLPHVSERS